jgi:TRAP-type mannitol/chloroaromatic compound transport system permease small subunit
MESTLDKAPEEGAAQPAGMVLHESLPPRGPWGDLLFRVSKAFALAGGALFLALVAMSLVSIVGRKLISMPVPGDIEMMQMGTAVAASALLAYCEMRGSHLRVDFFTAWMSPQNRAWLDGVAHLLLAFVAVLVAWRTAVAAVSNFESGETSMMLGWPVWIAIALIVPGLVIFALAGLYNAFQEFGRFDRTGEKA